MEQTSKRGCDVLGCFEARLHWNDGVLVSMYGRASSVRGRVVLNKEKHGAPQVKQKT